MNPSLSACFRRYAPAFVSILLVVALAACGPPKRPPVLAGEGGIGDGGRPGASAPDTSRLPPPVQPLDDGPDVRAIEGEDTRSSDIFDTSLAADGETGPLADILFEYDSAQLSPAAQSALEQHATWLQSHRDIKVVVEGHCDERGTVEYNLALGEQRARAARDYLATLGVAPERLRVVSYGKERPLDPAAAEAAYARNRRAHFVVSR